jgi:hypothetical protein
MIVIFRKFIIYVMSGHCDYSPLVPENLAMALFRKTLFQLSYDISFTLLTSKDFPLLTLQLTCTMTCKHTQIYISTNSTISCYSHSFGSYLWTFKSSIPLNIAEYLLTSIHINNSNIYQAKYIH